MRAILLISLLLGSFFSSFGQLKTDDLAYSLAINVLKNATEVGIGGDAGTPSEVLAFNFIYRSPSPAKRFKDVYQFSSNSAKFYCLMGLYLLKDVEYEQYKKSFLSLKSENGIRFRAGCLVENLQPNELLEIWIKGFATKVWFTEALIVK